LTTLAGVDVGPGSIAEEQLLVNATALFVAARETTIGAIGSGLLELARHPDQMQRLRVHPNLVPKAVEETLRYQTLLLQVRRSSTEPVQYCGITVPAGGGVIL